MSNDLGNLQPPSVQAQVDPTVAKLGDLITLDIRVTHPQALIVDPPAFAKSLGAFEVYASTRLPTEQAGLAGQMSGANAVDRFQAQLQNFTTGQQVLPGLEVPYRDPMGKVQTIHTPQLTVIIEAVPPGPKDKGDIRGIKGVIGPTAWSPWWWLAAVFLLSALCYLLWRKRKRALAGPPPPPPVPADEMALEKLRELAETDWLATGKIKEFYVAISDIVRAYLEGGFQTPALERTTSEIMRDLRKKSEIATERQAELRELLDTCDLVKFAKFRPDTVQAAQEHAAAVRFVEVTREFLHEREDAPPPLRGRMEVGGASTRTPHPHLPPQGGKGRER